MTASKKVSAALLIALVSASSTWAGPVTFQFSGEITRIYDPDNLLGEEVVVGEPFSGQVTFESTTPDDDPQAQRGFFEDALLDYFGTVGDSQFAPLTSPRGYVEVWDGSAFDELEIGGDITFLGYDLDFFIEFLDLSGMMVKNDELPATPPQIDFLEFRQFTIFDPTETYRVNITGTIQSIVPEPTTLCLLGLGLSAGAAIRRRKRMGSSLRGRNLLFVALLVSQVLLQEGAFAVDCNNNGVSDDIELSQACKVDLIVTFDTSNSMGFDINNLCAGIGALETNLQLNGIDLFIQKLSITSGARAVGCACCSAQGVPTLYGTATSGLTETLGVCGGDGAQEDWGPSTAVVAGNRTWRTGAIRVIVPISDEAPRCGDPLNDPGDDRNAVTNALSIVTARNVIVIPLVESGTLAVPLADDLATGRNLCEGPGGYVLTFTQIDLVSEMARIIIGAKGGK